MEKLNSLKNRMEKMNVLEKSDRDRDRLKQEISKEGKFIKSLIGDETALFTKSADGLSHMQEQVLRAFDNMIKAAKTLHE